MLIEEFKKINNDSHTIACQNTQKFIKNLINFGYATNKAILEDLNDEIEELKSELEVNNVERIKEELGDVVFVLCNLANQYGINLDESLDYSTKEFQRRFIYIENKVGEKIFKNLKMSEIVDLWKEAKNNN